MGKKENIIALKSLFSMVVALVSVIGIAITLFSYFIISPALTEMNVAFIDMASALVSMNDGLILFESDVNRVKTDQVQVTKNSLDNMKNSRDSIKAARESLQEIEKVNNYGLSSQLITLKDSEEDLTALILDAEVNYETLSQSGDSDLFKPELSSKLLRNVSTIDITIQSFSTLFTALTVIALIIFGVMILISIENLL